MSEQMEFPITFEKFAKEYGFKDDKEVYTNGSDLIPIFRVKQWIEQDNKLRTMEIDTAYECGKHANKWIPVTESTPPKGTICLWCNKQGSVFTSEITYRSEYSSNVGKHGYFSNGLKNHGNIIAWQPLPEPYEIKKEEEEC